MSSCVDDDYDLSKDIDLTVQIGGDHFTIPSSNTQPYTLSKIMDLGDDSSIVADTDGNYRLEQWGDPSDSFVKIEYIDIDIAKGNTVTSSCAINGASSITIGQELPDYENEINVESYDVTEDVISISHAWTTLQTYIEITPEVTNYSGITTIKKGFTIAFDEGMTVSSPASYTDIEDGHKVVFNQDYAVSGTLSVPVYVEEIALGDDNLDDNHDFTYNGNVVSTGSLGFNASALSSNSQLTLTIESIVEQGGKIIQLSGVVDPEVTVDDVKFEITGIPDFLREDGNVLDIENPQIYLSITNASPATVDVELTMTSVLNGTTVAAVTVVPEVVSGFNYICISRKAVTTAGITANIIEPGLSNLISTIPDEINVTVDQTKVHPEEIIFELFPADADGYEFYVENQVIAPLAFGSDLKLTYTDSDQDWDEDGDLHKYNFNTVEITATVVNTLPMTLTPDVEPIFLSGYSKRVAVDTHNAVIAPGTESNPVNTDIHITLTGLEDNLMGLDGVSFNFSCDNPIVGTPLNENQSAAFTNVVISIAGGITVDLN